MEMTEEEKKALRIKFDNPQKQVKCPRCGKEIIYEEYVNGIAVKCENKGCLYSALRGI